MQETRDKQPDNGSSPEEELHLTQEQLDVLIESVPVGIIASGLSGPLVFSNNTFCELTGYSSAELSRLALEDISAADDWPDTRDYLQSVVAGNGARSYHFVHLRKKSGELVEVSLFCAMTRGDDGGPELLIGQVQDMSEQRQTEKKLAEDRERLANIGRLSLLGEMVGGIAHEVTQPLTALSVYADSAARLLSANKLERLDEVVHKLGEQAKRAGEIMEQVQELAKVESPKPVRNNFNTLIEESFPLISSDMRMHNIRVSFDLEDSLPDVACDAVQVKQVILNLLRNSIDAIRLLGENASAEIEIRTSEDESSGGVVVSITDSGTGVSEEVATRVFEPFSPSGNSSMGFGLPICKSIVEAHDGQLDFYNNAGGGATFYFSLPLG
jgi:two-component system sensor kinase FixL